LLRKGAPADLVDDAVQEAALQAWRRSEPFDGPEGLLRWAAKVAWHAVTAEYSRRQRACTGEVPDVIDLVDPARIVQGRLELRALREHLIDLSDRDRAAVLSGVSGDEPTDPKERARVKERRHRGRQALRRNVRWATDEPG
jgi:DNA-directed RNA polymerase specialized sigma24 family protein